MRKEPRGMQATSISWRCVSAAVYHLLLPLSKISLENLLSSNLKRILIAKRMRSKGSTSIKRLHELVMTDKLERSRALMDLKFAELEAREAKLQSTIQDSVHKALEDYITNNPTPVSAPAFARIPGIPAG